MSNLFQPIEVRPADHFDGAWRAKIGVIVLSSDLGFEAEIVEILPRSLDAHFVRMPSYVDCTSRSATHEQELASTAGLLRTCPGISAYVYGCTSGELTYGRQTLVSNIQRATGCDQVITPMAATGDAMKELELTSTSILSPYDRKLNETMVAHLTKLGFAVDQVYEFTLPNDDAAPLVKGEFFLDAAREISKDNPVSLFIPCNALSVVRHIEALENLLHVPVLTSTQVSVWSALSVVQEIAPAKMGIPGRLFSNLNRGIS